MSSGDVLASVLEHSETIFVHIFDDEVKYGQILTVNVMAINALGSNGPGSASMGFPIGNHIVTVRGKC